MKALIVSEGPHELSGAIESLARRLTLKLTGCDHDCVSSPDVHTHSGKGKGYFKRAVAWLLEAKRRGYDAVVLVIDEDGKSERSKQISEAQESQLATLSRAMGVAIRSFDAWILADEAALTSVLQLPIPRQPSPEAIKNPKQVCTTLRNQSSKEIALRDMYREVLLAADLTVLEERCPKGLAPFAARVRSL